MKAKQPRVLLLAALTATPVLLAPSALAQGLSKSERGKVVEMLNHIVTDVKKHYYDPNLHGIDWDATVEDTREKIKASPDLNLSMSLIAQALVSLNDSHTYFVPPVRAYAYSYGYQTQMIGDRCYVIGVRPGSDAEAKGVKSGDEVLGIDGFKPERDTLWKIDYRYNVLRPQPTLALIIRDLKGQTRQLEVAAKVKEVARISDASGSSDAQLRRDRETQRHLTQPRWAEAGDDLGVLKIPFFMFAESEVDHLINKARKRSALIVDLRGNPGGAIDTLKYLVGDVFEHDVKIADRLARGESKPEVARSRGSGAFTGKVIAVVDSKSGSASELFARVLQLEKRGTVIGDRSSGAVMEASDTATKLE